MGDLFHSTEALYITIYSNLELWVVTKRMTLRIQSAEMSFLCRMAELSLKGSSEIRRELGGGYFYKYTSYSYKLLYPSLVHALFNVIFIDMKDTFRSNNHYLM